LWQPRAKLMRRSGRLKRVWIAFGVAVSMLSSPPSRAQDAPDGVAAELVVRALALVDTPYKYGGRTPAGFDCSGFVGYVFAEASGLVLPRRSEDIVRVGDPLERDRLVAGDLVFFNTLGRRYSHVGIYIGEGRFVHAPARGGRVRVERISDPYWRARYNAARRFGSVQPALVANSAVQAAPAAPPTAAEPEERITP
jgi:cell wall-associated NlpC family hydrolase